MSEPVDFFQFPGNMQIEMAFWYLKHFKQVLKLSGEEF